MGLGLLAARDPDSVALQSGEVEASLERLEAELSVVSGLLALEAGAEEVQGAAYGLAGVVDGVVLDRGALFEADAAAAGLLARLDGLPGGTGLDALVLRRALSSPNQLALDRLWEEFVLLSTSGLGAGLAELAGGESGIFAVRGQQLALRDRLAGRALELEGSGLELEGSVSRLLDDAGMVSGAVLESTVGSFDQGRVLLSVISVVSVIVATLAAWLWVGNGMVRRLSRLSERMRRMADGDLEMPVPEVGRDEIGQLADALEVFRQQALEVQRLNLVEQLYGELRAANEELTRMQARLVAQEKLAALGELVSGVAHEISNPLSFIKNFSEGSVGLYSELSEMLEGYRDVMTEGDAALMDEIGVEIRDSLDGCVPTGAGSCRLWSGCTGSGWSGGSRSRPT